MPPPTSLLRRAYLLTTSTFELCVTHGCELFFLQFAGIRDTFTQKCRLARCFPIVVVHPPATATVTSDEVYGHGRYEPRVRMWR